MPCRDHKEAAIWLPLCGPKGLLSNEGHAPQTPQPCGLVLRICHCPAVLRSRGDYYSLGDCPPNPLWSPSAPSLPWQTSQSSRLGSRSCRAKPSGPAWYWRGCPERKIQRHFSISRPTFVGWAWNSSPEMKESACFFISRHSAFFMMISR